MAALYRNCTGIETTSFSWVYIHFKADSVKKNTENNTRIKKNTGNSICF